MSLPFENLDGIILVTATLRGPAADTTGLLALDTGAGFLAIDVPVAERLGLLDDLAPAGSIDFADRPLRRLEIGPAQIDQVSPVLVLDAGVVRRVTDRPVLGLLGERPLAGRALWIDYRAERWTLIPAPPVGDSDPGGAREDRAMDRDARLAASRARFAGLMGGTARAVEFRIAGDGKMLVGARISEPARPWDGRTNRFSARKRGAKGQPSARDGGGLQGRATGSADSLVLIVDTGATKTVFFETELTRKEPDWRRWPALSGLAAPTLFGVSEARVVRVPWLELLGGAGAVARSEMDAAVIESPLARALSQVIGEPVDGLIGYSFLRRYRVGIDYAASLLWLDPLPEPWDDRPHEYSHVGLQIERGPEGVEVVAIAEGSPAARAGLRAGDRLLAVNGRSAARHDLEELGRMLEGRPGTRVRIRILRDGSERSYTLVRRRLL